MKYNKNVVITTAVLLVLIAGGLMVQASEPGNFLYPVKAYFSGEVTYVQNVSDEVTLLQEDLAHIETQISINSLSTEDVVVAREKIAVRIQKINDTIKNADNATLTPQMRAMLLTTLSKLTAILTTYRDSLVTLETLASASTIDIVDSESSKNNSKAKPLTEMFEDAVTEMSQQIIETTEGTSDAEENNEETVVDESETDATSTDVDNTSEETESIPDTESSEEIPASDVFDTPETPTENSTSPEVTDGTVPTEDSTTTVE